MVSIEADTCREQVFSRLHGGDWTDGQIAELARREGRDYEAAAELLERIKQQREAQNVAKPKKHALIRRRKTARQSKR